MHLPIHISGAAVVPGRQRGRRIGIPTVNIDLASAPKELQHGIYACWMTTNGKRYKGAMHYGPRPAFKDSETFEVHILDETLPATPKTVDVDVLRKIRDVEDFPTTEALVARINQDIAEVRGILGA